MLNYNSTTNVISNAMPFPSLKRLPSDDVEAPERKRRREAQEVGTVTMDEDLSSDDDQSDCEMTVSTQHVPSDARPLSRVEVAVPLDMASIYDRGCSLPLLHSHMSSSLAIVPYLGKLPETKGAIHACKENEEDVLERKGDNSTAMMAVD